MRLGEQEEWVKLLRQKSGLVVAFGSCAHLGGIPGLGNFWTRDAIFQRVYKEAPTVENPEGTLPQVKTRSGIGELALPEFYDTVKTLDQTIAVDYYLPGCPPPPDLIMKAVNAILTEQLPKKGAVLAPCKALCDTCPRNETKPEKLSIKGIKRPSEVIIDPKECFLMQGLICLGPATRSGCGERCIKANMPCRGCFGPLDSVVDQGAKMLFAIASLLRLEEEKNMTEKDIQRLVDQIVDPAGTFYRFSLPASILRRRKMERSIK